MCELYYLSPSSTIMFDAIMHGVSKSGRSLVEVWWKFGRSFDTSGVEVWSTFRPNFDPQCRSLVGIPTKLRPPSVEVWSKSRPSFDTPVSNICTYKLQDFDMIDPDCGRELWIHIRINRFILMYLYMCIYIYIYFKYT